MANPLLPEELAGEFFAVGSVGGTDHESTKEYVQSIKLPYTFQLPAFKEEDMIRQFGVLIEGFEEEGSLTLDVDPYTYREVVDDIEPIIPEEPYFRSLYLMVDGTHYKFLKTQQTAPATLGFSIRGSDGRQLLSKSLLRLFTSLMKRVSEGQMSQLAKHSDALLLCQDDPTLGYVVDLVNRGEVDFTVREVTQAIERVYPKDALPCYHYCDDWRMLKVNEQYILWEAKPKMVHIDVLAYPPNVDRVQADAINSFLERGGGLAIGVLPNVDDEFQSPVSDVFERNLKRAVRDFDSSGVDLGLLKRRTMVSTRCGLAGASERLSKEIHTESKHFAGIFNNILSEHVA
ncbi:MAG: hypothetical protein EAX95_05875 [Candidatus Thorarchaeota archaeon]|nr:hypothetical protein [Candidatus Thorarchaeota archaeon]